MGVMSSSLFAEKLDSQFRNVKVAGIVTGRKFKVSDKGRFAFVQLSDMGGVFEVSIFNEGLLNQQRDNLEKGKILLIGPTLKWMKTASRLIAQNITLFDEALAKRKGNGRPISHRRQSAAKRWPQFAACLAKPNGLGVAVTLSAEIGAERADIELPGKYAVSPIILDKIRVVKGVVSAEEDRRLNQRTLTLLFPF